MIDLFPPTKQITAVVRCLTERGLATADEITDITKTPYWLVKRILTKMNIAKYAVEIDGEWTMTL